MQSPKLYAILLLSLLACATPPAQAEQKYLTVITTEFIRARHVYSTRDLAVSDLLGVARTVLQNICEQKYSPLGFVSEDTIKLTIFERGHTEEQTRTGTQRYQLSSSGASGTCQFNEASNGEDADELLDFSNYPPPDIDRSSYQSLTVKIGYFADDSGGAMGHKTKFQNLIKYELDVACLVELGYLDPSSIKVLNHSFEIKSGKFSHSIEAANATCYTVKATKYADEEDAEEEQPILTADNGGDGMEEAQKAEPAEAKEDDFWTGKTEDTPAKEQDDFWNGASTNTAADDGFWSGKASRDDDDGFGGGNPELNSQNYKIDVKKINGQYQTGVLDTDGNILFPYGRWKFKKISRYTAHVEILHFRETIKSSSCSSEGRAREKLTKGVIDRYGNWAVTPETKTHEFDTPKDVFCLTIEKPN